jgi:hypothetical protein
MVGGNPVYDAPADLNFRANIEKVPFRIHLSLYDDETSALCHWHVPESHYLESWGDARAFDGTVSIIQPLIAPLYRGTKSPLEFMAAFTQQPERTGYEILRTFWQGKIGAGGAALRSMVMQGTGQSAASTQGTAATTGSTTTPPAQQNTNQSGQAANTQSTNTRAANTQGAAAVGNQAARTQNSNQTANTQGAAASTSNTAQAGAPTQNGSTAQGASTQAAAQGGAAATDFETQWRRVLHNGVIENTSLPARTVSLASNWDSTPPQPAPNPNELEVVFRADPSIYDGRFANNGWLQELPKPLSKITWDTAAIISPATARRLGLENSVGWKGGDWNQPVVNLTFQNRTVPFPIWVQPGQPDNTIAVHLGYGRWRSGRAGTETARRPAPFQNAYALRTSDALWSGTGLRLEKTADTYVIATTQLHHLMENRDLVRAGTLEDYQKNPSFAPAEKHEPKREDTMYENYDYSKDYAWGMAIDV